MTQSTKARTPRTRAAEAPSARRRSRAARPIARASRSRRTRTAFVLSGGASLGALQVGMLRALYERGITADVLVGTSVGALNAAFIASVRRPLRQRPNSRRCGAGSSARTRSR